MLALASAVAGAVVAGVIAWWLDARRRRQERSDVSDHDLWGAINSLRNQQADTNEHLAELRGLVAGLYGFHGEAIPSRPPRRNRNRTRQRIVDTERGEGT